MAVRTKTPSQDSAGNDSLAVEDHDEAAFRAKLASIARANREAAGLSPGEAARRAHISRAAVLDFEGRRSWPRVDTLVAYARAIGTTPWALLHRAHTDLAAPADDLAGDLAGDTAGDLAGDTADDPVADPADDPAADPAADRAEPSPSRGSQRATEIIDLNAILFDAGVSQQTWRTAKALLEALVAAER